jgi:excisionase family DNA binding protein
LSYYVNDLAAFQVALTHNHCDVWAVTFFGRAPLRSVDDCAREARTSKGKIRKDIRSGLLRAVKVGTLVRVLDSDWDAYVASWPDARGAAAPPPAKPRGRRPKLARAG